MFLMAGLDIFILALFFLSAFVFSPLEIYMVFLAFLAPFLLVFALNWLAWVGAGMTFLLLFYANRRMRASIQNRLKVSFYPLLLFGGSSMVTAMALLFAFGSYFYPINVEQLQIKQETFKPIFSLIEPLIKTRVPNYQSGMTIDDFLKATISSSIEEGLKEISVKAGLPSGGLPPALQSQITGAAAGLAEKEIQEQIKHQRLGLGKRIGVELTGREDLEGLIILVSNSYINRYAQSYREFIPMVVAVSVFFSFKSLSFFINRLALFLAWVLAQILRSANIIKKQTAQVDKETLVIA